MTKDNPVAAGVAIPADIKAVAVDVEARWSRDGSSISTRCLLIDAIARAILDERNRAASPVQAGIDPLVAEIEAGSFERLDAAGNSIGRMPTELERRAAALLRSQAERIAALEVERDHWRGVFAQHDAEEKFRFWMGEHDREIAERRAAESLLAEAREALEKAQVDADRWNALLRCARINMWGSAGFDPKTGERREHNNSTGEFEKTSDGWVHFGAEFWSIYPDHEDADKANRWGTIALTALADDVLLKEAEDRATLSRLKPGEKGGSDV